MGFDFVPPLRTWDEPLQRQILDQSDAIPGDEDIAESVFDDPGPGGFGFTFPFMAVGDTFPVFRKLQNVIHLTHRTGRFTHRRRA